MINDALREHLDIFVVVYLDDILVYSRTLEEYQLYISKVLEYLGVRDLRLKPEKYKFYKEEVDFLGFIIGRNGIRIDPAKLWAVKEWPVPSNVKEIFNSSILKVNKDGSLSANQHEINTTLRILRDNQEQFPVEKGKLQVPDNKIDECIKEHYNRPL